jgi:hypothetical protein
LLDKDPSLLKHPAATHTNKALTMSKITASTAFCSLAEVLIKGRRHALLLL